MLSVLIEIPVDFLAAEYQRLVPVLGETRAAQAVHDETVASLAGALAAAKSIFRRNPAFRN